jgi:hypothetical protein
VFGEAHGSAFEEHGFESENEATEYAATIIDGDTDSAVEVVRDR